MGVITTADEYLAKMREDVDTAVKSIHHAYAEIVVGDCWGSDELSDLFKEKLKKLHLLSMEMRDLAGRPR